MVAAQSGVGVVYGLHKMDKDTVSEFIEWLIRQNDPIGYVLRKHLIGSCEFNAAWMDFSSFIQFGNLQNKFMGEKKNG